MLKSGKLSETLGVEISGVDLSQPLAPAIRDEILNLLDHHGVALIRGQQLSMEQFLAFSRQVGPLATHSLKQYSAPGCPEIMINSNIVENGRPLGLADGGQHWHTDGGYLETSYRATILYAVEVPVRDGISLGDTLFASTSGAYDRLDPDTRSKLDGLRARHCHGVARMKRAETLKLEGSDTVALRKTVEHPAVRTHPYTGRKCIYVNPGSTLGFAGLDPDESDSLLEQLFNHITSPDYLYRHNWRAGDVVMWDNCSTQHRAVGDYHPLRRLLYRTIVQGDKPF